MKIAKTITDLYDELKPTSWGSDATITGKRGGRVITIKRIKWYGKIFYKYRVQSRQWSPMINIKQLETRFNAIPRTPKPADDNSDDNGDDNV